MPELPEVETTLRGITPFVRGKVIVRVDVRNGNLRWPVPADISFYTQGKRVEAISRRAKYLLFKLPQGHLMIHLGMSGRLRIVQDDTPVEKHDHVDFCLDSGNRLRFTDPRRFGSVLWIAGDPGRHKLLKGLGPEPFDPGLDGEYLYHRSRGKTVPIKSFLMDSRVLVGVGNIYANEALFKSGIAPTRTAGRISLASYQKLLDNVRVVLQRAIEAGGTTLRDFVDGNGKPGYFQQQLNVYGRGGKACMECGAILREIRLGQRATVYCTRCQR